MVRDFEHRYRAVRSRDTRFDGWFFVAVTSTGIYCRPSCPAVTPKRPNRCFPSKTVAVWHRLDDRGHMRLVERYLEEAGNFDNIHSLDRSPRRLFSDPLYAVVGRSTGPYAGKPEAPQT